MVDRCPSGQFPCLLSLHSLLLTAKIVNGMLVAIIIQQSLLHGKEGLRKACGYCHTAVVTGKEELRNACGYYHTAVVTGKEELRNACGYYHTAVVTAW